MSRAARVKTPARSRLGDAMPPPPPPALLQKTLSTQSRVTELTEGDRDALGSLLPSVVQVFTEAAPPNWCVDLFILN